MSTATRSLHDELEALILGTTDRAPEYGGGQKDVPDQQVVAAPTVADLEESWGHDRDEWSLLGSPADDDEPVAIVRVVKHSQLHRRVYYRIERTDEDGISYVAIDRQFTMDELADDIREHHTGEGARPELEVLDV